MPTDSITQTYATLHLKHPQRMRNKPPILKPTVEIIVDRDRAPGSYLPSSKALSFDPPIKFNGQRSKWDQHRDLNRLEVVADLGSRVSGAGEVCFEVEFGWLDTKVRLWDLAAHLYLNPPARDSLPLDNREPIWLGGTTLPKSADQIKASIASHWVAPDRRRGISFAELTPENEERTLLLTLHRIRYIKTSVKSPPTNITPNTDTSYSKKGSKRKKVKSEHFQPDPDFLLVPSKSNKRSQLIGDGLMLKDTERVEPFEACSVVYDDHREAPLVEFVFHCRSSLWIDEHSPLEPSSSNLSLLSSPFYSTKWVSPTPMPKSYFRPNMHSSTPPSSAPPSSPLGGLRTKKRRLAHE